MISVPAPAKLPMIGHAHSTSSPYVSRSTKVSRGTDERQIRTIYSGGEDNKWRSWRHREIMQGLANKSSFS
jgi:hypothetical protein